MVQKRSFRSNVPAREATYPALDQVQDRRSFIQSLGGWLAAPALVGLLQACVGDDREATPGLPDKGPKHDRGLPADGSVTDGSPLPRDGVHVKDSAGLKPDTPAALDLTKPPWPDILSGIPDMPTSPLDQLPGPRPTDGQPPDKKP